MKIMQAIAGAEYGGAEAFFERLAVALHDAGFDQKIVIRANKGRGARLRARGIEPVELLFGGRLDFRTTRKLKRIAKAYQPDIVVTWMNRASQKMPKGPWVQVARLGGYYDLKYYRTCDHLVGNTRDIQRYIVDQGWPENRAHYLPNFVSSQRAEPVNRAELHTPPNAPVILALGRLHENKAFDVLLQALVKVPDAYLWLAGEGPLRRELEGMAGTLGVRPRVRFLGWRQDVAELFAASDLFVCPSRHEPLGNVVLEAWAQYVPVVAADSLGPGTLITQEETGILVPVDDHKAMGQAIRYLLGNTQEADRLARNAWDAYQKNFTESAVVDAYRDFFEKILAMKQGRGEQAD